MDVLALISSTRPHSYVLKGLLKVVLPLFRRRGYLKDVLMRLPTQRAGEIGQLLSHQWMPAWLTQGE